MRLIYLVMSCLLVLGTMAFVGQEEMITVTCETKDCDKVMTVYQFDGAGFKPYKGVQGKDGVFTFTVPKSEPSFYYIGKEMSKLLPVILGTEEKVVVKGTCKDMRNAVIEGSALNQQYQNLKATLNDHKSQTGGLIQQFRAYQNNELMLKRVMTQLAELDAEKRNLLDSLSQANPFLAKIVALNTYVSYQHNGEGYDNEIDYFARAYFQFVDFKDEAYNRLPWVFEVFQGYTNTLSSLNLPNELHKEYIETAMKDIPEGSDAQKMALSGVLSMLSRKKHDNFIYFGEKFIAAFKESDPFAAKNLEDQIAFAKSFRIGGEAPDFSQPKPDGEALKLSDLRGKVVLVDFWASWCGPCRRENPNVVRLYEQYKDAGFDVLGVSLDNKKDRWLKAIKDDGLTWHHVSDLKGWQNEVAVQYGVSSIPHTVLLDREGRIIGRNLRGPALERKLEEVFQ